MSIIRIYQIIVIFLLVAAGLSYYTLLKLDPSTAAISRHLVPELNNREYKNRPYSALISYADGPDIFFRNQFSLAASAADKGFDIIYNYRKGHIEPKFYQENSKILDSPRGAGFWLWKPYFILKTMQELPEDSIIIYADSGVVLTKPVDSIINLLDENQVILVGHGKPTPLTHHLKTEALELFPELAKHKDNGQNIWAFFIALRNNKENREFIKQWLDMCTIAEAIMDKPMDKTKQISNFIFHQHDQSLLSLLVAANPEGKLVIRRNILRQEYGVNNFHRHPKDKLTSPLYIQAGLTRIISNIFWNNYLLQYLRTE